MNLSNEEQEIIDSIKKNGLIKTLLEFHSILTENQGLVDNNLFVPYKITDKIIINVFKEIKFYCIVTFDLIEIQETKKIIVSTPFFQCLANYINKELKNKIVD